MLLIKNHLKWAFKWTTCIGCAPIRYNITYSLPTQDEPGNWAPTIQGKLRDCHRGYHLVDASHIKDWHEHGRRLFLAQMRGGIYEAYNGAAKLVCRSFRLYKEIHFTDSDFINAFLIKKMLKRNGIEIIEPGDSRHYRSF